MRTIKAASLRPVGQDDIIIIVRLARALVTNLRVYPEGHSIVQSVAGRVGERVAKVGETSGALLVGSDTSMLSVNRDSIYKDCDEQKFALELAAWLRERGVDNIYLDLGVESDEVLKLFGWLHRTDPSQARTILKKGTPRELDLDKVDVNVRAPKSDEDIRQTLETMDLTPMLRRAGLTGEIDWTQTDLGRMAKEGKLDNLVDSERMEAFVEKYFTERFDADNFAAARLQPEDIDGIMQRLKEDLSGIPVEGLDETIATKAAEAVARLIPDAVGSYLSTELPTEGTAQQVRVGVLEQLRGDTAKQGSVLKEITVNLGSVSNAAQGLGCLHAMETLVPQALAGGERTAAFDAVGSIALASLPGRPEELRGRARMSLRYLASPELLGTLLHHLQTAAPAERDRTQDLLRVLGPYAVPTLMEEMRNSMRRAVRTELVDVLVHVGQRALMEGDDPSLVLDPLVRELDNHSDNPWYFTRNVVAILGSVGGTSFQTKLVQLLGGNVDARIRTEVARGLMRSDTDSARRLLREVVFGRGLDPTGMAVVVPYLLRADTAATLESLEGLLLDKDLPEDLGGAALTGLALDAGAQVLPVLRKVLDQRSGLLKRSTFAEPMRLASLDALSVIPAGEARAVINAAREDKSAAIRRRATELSASDPAEQAERARNRLRLDS